MTRQRIRKLALLLAMLLFPVTLYYFSPALIVNAAFRGIVNGSFVVFAAMFLLSIPLGRVFCAYLCPAGGLQECLFAVKNKKPAQGRRNGIKYGIWGVWIAVVAAGYILNGQPLQMDLLFETDRGISVHDVQSYVIYYGIVLLVALPCLLGGKRAFCHYLCWMAPFMVLGIKLRRLLRLPGLHITVKKESACVACGKCNAACPMGVNVAQAVQMGGIRSAECIQCGACVDQCPAQVLAYGLTERTTDTHGNGKESGLRNFGAAQP